MTPDELAAWVARFRARMAEPPAATKADIDRAAANDGAIRLRKSRDRARAHCETATPQSRTDHGASNVAPSAPVSGVGN
jgi:hypothetical protein